MEKRDLTFPQKNIYMVELINGDNALNTIAGVLKINDSFDSEICKKIINEVIKQNDATRINIIEGENISQVVNEYKYVYVQEIDMKSKSEEEVNKLLDDLTKEKIDIYSNSLITFYVISTHDKSGMIYLKMHHIIGDAWTLMQITNQLTEMYEKILNGEDISFEVPSYLEFIDSEIEYEKSEKCEKDREFWKEYLKDVKEPVSLKDRTKKISNSAKRYSVLLSSEQNTAIEEYCKKNRVSPYTLFMTALATYIYRIKDANDIIIGTPILNRSNFREKKMLGCFISTIPMRIRIEEGVKFLDLVKSVTTKTMSLFRHQKYPITKILEDIHNESENSGKIYNLMLSYQNARADVPSNMSTEWIFSKYIQDDLEIHIMDMDSVRPSYNKLRLFR
ncbi:MAG: hypothetical protein IJ809_01270 [Clostridia bacterium]|nr:hypothetical protein [Clostridia bacterium]